MKGHRRQVFKSCFLYLNTKSVHKSTVKNSKRVYCFHLRWFFSYEVGPYWKSRHAYRSWFPHFETSQEIILFIYRYIMLSKLTRFNVYVWILVWKKILWNVDVNQSTTLCRLIVPRKIKRRMLNRLNTLWCRVLYKRHISLFSKFIQNDFDISLYQPFLTKRTMFIKIVVNVTQYLLVALFLPHASRQYIDLLGLHPASQYF